MVKVWAVGQGWDLGRDLVKAEGWVCLVLCAGLAPSATECVLVTGLALPAVELLVAGLAPPATECVLVAGLALPGVGWALVAVKDWGQALLPGCV